MLYRFIGEYTNGDTINVGGRFGVNFHGREPAEVEDPELLRRLANHVEFEACEDDESEDELAALRAQYTEKLGKKPYHGWDAATLTEKMNG